MSQYNYKKGLSAMAICYLIWGFQPLYFALCSEIDTFFLMACRIIWAAAGSLLVLRAQGKISLLKAAFCDKEVLRREIPATLFIFIDWVVYLWAVQNGRVMECSLGYYIQPLVVFFFGALIFKEKISWRHIAILVIVVIGIVLSARGFHGIPVVTITLAVSFAIYAAIKKSLTIDSIVSTSMEMLMMLPLALLFILLFRMGENGISALTVLRQVLLIGCGVVTCIPMLFYAIGVRHLPMMTIGICQYLSPTLAIFCGMIMKEHLTKEKLISFLFIWIGVILYTLNTFYEEKRRKESSNQRENKAP